MNKLEFYSHSFISYNITFLSLLPSKFVFIIFISLSLSYYVSLRVILEEGKPLKFSVPSLYGTLKKEYWMENILVLPDDRSLFCIIPKAANTNWKVSFIRKMNNGSVPKGLDPPDPSIWLNEWMRQQPKINSRGIWKGVRTPWRLDLYPENEIEYMLTNYKAYVAVRNPISRYISGFFDKGHRLKSQTDIGIGLNQIIEDIPFCGPKRVEGCDHHFSPQYEVCGMKRITYERIVHLEDKKAILQLLHHFNIPPNWFFWQPHHFTNSQEKIKTLLNNSKFSKEELQYMFISAFAFDFISLGYNPSLSKITEETQHYSFKEEKIL